MMDGHKVLLDCQSLEALPTMWRLHPLLTGPILLAIKLFEYLWSVETYVKGYVLKLLLADVHIKTV
jgi:hypothetical protein